MAAEIEANEISRALLRIWQTRRRGAGLLRRRDLDPAAMPQILPYAFIVDISPAPRTYRARLIGTRVVELAGRDMTGMYFSTDSHGEHVDSITTMFDAAVDTPAPVLGKGRLLWSQARSWIVVEILCLPVLADSGQQQIFGTFSENESTALLPAKENAGLTFERLEMFIDPSVAVAD